METGSSARHGARRRVRRARLRSCRAAATPHPGASRRASCRARTGRTMLLVVANAEERPRCPSLGVAAMDGNSIRIARLAHDTQSYQAQAWTHSRGAPTRPAGTSSDDATGGRRVTRCHPPASPPAAAAARPASPRSSGETIRSRRRGGRGIRCYKRMTMTTRTSRCAQSL